MAKKATIPVSNTPESVAPGGAGNPASSAPAAEPTPGAGAASPIEVATEFGTVHAVTETPAFTPPDVAAATDAMTTELRSFSVTKPVRYKRRRFAKGEPIMVDLDEWAVLFVGGVLAEEWDAVPAGEV